MIRKYFIPTPPSVNSMWCNSFNGSGKGRYRSSKYNDWLNKAIALIKSQDPTPITCQELSLAISVARPSRRCDIDNRIKAIPDLLQKTNIIKNDSIINEIKIRWIAKDEETFIVIKDHFID